MSYLAFFILQLTIIFLITRWLSNEIFKLLKYLLKSDRICFIILSLIYLPGTILHEISHMLGAMILLLKVKSITIFPEFEENSIRLGSVKFEKKDLIRNILVGVSPLFSGLAFFYFIFSLHVFPATGLLLNLVFIYLIFVVSSTMFSSRQDLVDLVYLVPFVAIILLVIYIFKIHVEVSFGNSNLFTNLLNFLKALNYYLLISLVINTAFFLILKFINRKTLLWHSLHKN